MNFPSPSPSPLETQLGDDLRQLAAGGAFTPDLTTIKQQARRRRRRGLALRGAAAAGVAVVAGGVFVGVHGTAGGSAGSTSAERAAAAAKTAGPRPGAVQTVTVAYLSAQVKAALGNVNAYVLRDSHVQTGSSGDTSVILTDPRTGNAYEVLHDNVGTSLAWLSTYLVDRVLTWKDTEADYSTRTWFVSVIHAAGPVQGSTAEATSTVMTPAEVKSWLDSGQLTIVGHKVIDGHQTIGLRQPWIRGYREMWVDSTTFLPAQLITADFANQKGPLQNVVLIDNETWLPRTRTLLDEVNQVHLPAGFTQVAPPQ